MLIWRRLLCPKQHDPSSTPPHAPDPFRVEQRTPASLPRFRQGLWQRQRRNATRHAEEAFGFQRGERSGTSTITSPSGNVTFALKRRGPVIPRVSILSVSVASDRHPPNMSTMPGHIWSYSTSIVTRHWTRYGFRRTAQVVLDTPAHVSIREAIGDLDTIREAMGRLDSYRQLQPSAFTSAPSQHSVTYPDMDRRT